MSLDAAALEVCQAEVRAADLASPEAAEEFRIHWLGRKGRMKDYNFRRSRPFSTPKISGVGR